MNIWRQHGQEVSPSDSQSTSPRLWQLAGFFLGRPEFKSSAMLVHVNSQLVTSWGFQSCYAVFELFVSKYLSEVTVN